MVAINVNKIVAFSTTSYINSKISQNLQKLTVLVQPAHKRHASYLQYGFDMQLQRPLPLRTEAAAGPKSNHG